MNVTWNGFSDQFLIITIEAIMFIVSDVITITRFTKYKPIAGVALKNLKGEVLSLNKQCS